MKIINPHSTIIFLIILLVVSCGTGSSKKEEVNTQSPQGTTSANDETLEVVEERTAGAFSVLVETQNIPMHSTYIISTLNADNIKIDNIEFPRSFSMATGCSDETSGKYSFVNDTQFVVTINEYTISCGSAPDSYDPADGIPMEHFIKIIDPYEIVTLSKTTAKNRHYSISEEGKVVLDSSTTEVLEDKISGLEVFDLMPKENLRVLRNYIFAKYGYKFKNTAMQDFFAEQDWYVPKYDNVDSLLTDRDEKIIVYLKHLEEK